MATLSPAAVPAAFQQAFEHHKAGRTGEAAALYEQIILAVPDHADALHLLGALKAQQGDPAEGERLIAAALEVNAGVPMMWSNHGNALGLQGKREAAIASYDRALALAPGFVEAHYSRNAQLIAAGRAAQALADIDRALVAMPGHHVLTTGRAHALMALKRFDEALAGYQTAAAANPRNIDALAGQGKALSELDRPTDALTAFERALALAPADRDSVLGRALAQTMVGRADEALATMDRVIAVLRDSGVAHYIRGHAQLALQRTAEALESFRKAAALEPLLLEAVYNQADALRALGRYSQAIPVFESVLAQEPQHSHALGGLAYCAMQCCDWSLTERLRPLILENVRAGTRGIDPFTVLLLSSSAQLHLECARTFARYTCRPPSAPLPSRGPRTSDRIRIGYLSSDFRRHAMAFQMAELFEVHDRSRFEVIGFSGGPDDGSPIRKRIAASFDSFHDVAARSNEQIARLMHSSGIDIAVDLNGHTAFSRIGALAWRPAPAQATYLGFPGTSGVPFIDYVIADSTVAPMSEQPFFAEHIVHLPGCYQVSDRLRTPAATVPSRTACGLPEGSFIYCCFNSSYKISAEIFDVWMRIVAATPGSVLWLVRASDEMVANLRRQAGARGIDPERLVFCSVVEPDAHLARHALADLYLDTLPYNSHGTGSFALWAGLPMLTCTGPTFAGRVATSLLRAIDMPELAVETLADYETQAIALATNPTALAGLRAKLAVNRLAAPLFDTDRFRRHIEAAYTTMHEIALRGEAPRSFAVPPQD